MRTTVEATAEETAGVLAFTFEEGGEHWPTVGGVKVPWETCQTFSGSWGYARDELTWKPPEELLTILIQSVSKGGNLIMNVGPTARGRFDARALARLADFGAWMDVNSRAKAAVKGSRT